MSCVLLNLKTARINANLTVAELAKQLVPTANEFYLFNAENGAALDSDLADRVAAALATDRPGVGFSQL